MLCLFCLHAIVRLSISPVSIVSYRMSTLELSELKKQLEELLERKCLAECFIVGCADVASQEERW